MPLEVPDLDDRTFDDLVKEALAMLPRYAPAWTNHNPSDPGITLIELLAYFTEMLTYRLNRVSRESKVQFLQLLRGPEWDEWEYLVQASLDKVDEAIRAAVLDLRQPQRAVTREDFEYLAREAAVGDPGLRKVFRAHCVPRRDLGEERLRGMDLPGHVSVIILPDSELRPEEFDLLLVKIREYLAPKCLLTTRLHVVKPIYLWVSLSADIRPQAGASFDKVREKAIAALHQYFSPFSGGGPEEEGWPFGRNIYLSEIFDILERVPGVDYVEDVRVLQLSGSQGSIRQDKAAIGIQIGIRSTVGLDSRIGTEFTIDKDRLIRNDAGKLVAIALRPYELVRIAVREEDIQLSTRAASRMLSGK